MEVENGEVERWLSEFAHGTRSRESLETCLSGIARLRFWDTNERGSEMLRRLPKVTFTREDVDAQLRRYLAKGITARELSDWAAAMRLLGCFVLREEDPTSSEIWDLMDEIMSPDVWGPISTESVLALRGRLDNIGL